jgi:hypothetical protein
VHRRDLELLAAGPADHLVIDANQVIAQLRELGAIAFIRARRQPIFLGPPHPSHGVLIGPAATGTTEPLFAALGFVEEECALI